MSGQFIGFQVGAESSQTSRAQLDERQVLDKNSVAVNLIRSILVATPLQLLYDTVHSSRARMTWPSY